MPLPVSLTTVSVPCSTAVAPFFASEPTASAPRTTTFFFFVVVFVAASVVVVVVLVLVVSSAIAAVIDNPAITESVKIPSVLFMIAPCEFVPGHFVKFVQFLLQIALGITLYSLLTLIALRSTDMRINSQRLIMLFTALCMTVFCGPARAASDVDIKAQTEAVQLLSDYLKIDTTNPPGNERLGAEYLAGILRKNGLEAEIFDTTPNRSCVYARLKGTGKKKAIVLLNHIDVVPARAEDWKYPPFGGEIHNGELWGRGALDMKGMGIIELEAMLRIKRSGVKLDSRHYFPRHPR